MKIRETIAAVLDGKLDLESQPEAIQSVCQLYIYQGACEILGLPDKDERRAALLKIPEKIRPHIEKEARRLWQIRKTSGLSR